MPPARWKTPPLVKVYEALGAIGDGRVHLLEERRATVVSSDGTKTYDVETSDDGRQVSSNDNASYWQGYLGYPGIAVLIARGFLRSPPDAVEALSGIPWKEINRRFRNDWARTIAEVNRRMAESGKDPDAVRIAAEQTLEALKKLAPDRGKRRRPHKSRPARREAR